jgi:hypothetical protein
MRNPSPKMYALSARSLALATPSFVSVSTPPNASCGALSGGGLTNNCSALPGRCQSHAANIGVTTTAARTNHENLRSTVDCMDEI